MWTRRLYDHVMDHFTRSSRNVFSGLVLNRKPFAPDDKRLWELSLSSSRALFVIIRGDEILFDSDRTEPLFLDHAILDACHDVTPSALLLGDDGEHSYFALNLDQLPEQARRCLSGLGDFATLRQHVAILPPQTAALLGYARFTAGWHGRTKFCSSCGSPTRSRLGAQAKICTNPACGREHYPRVDPAMIVQVYHGDSCLLARQVNWRPKVYSALAGYVEAGESAEDAVVREVLEETGISVTDIRYHSSQPWPFSGSLMLGFHARATSTHITLDDTELEDAQWFSRRDIPQLLEKGLFALPPTEAIARQLFDAWYHGDGAD